MGGPLICEPGGAGTFFPLFDSEQGWNRVLRAVLYMAAMLYLFLGVNVVADKFVSSIETITSSRKRIWSKKLGRMVTVTTWNATVANLTLMALGSSAPEILLSTAEIMMGGFFSGELGPSTIVGSAAFNLFVIIAVCIATIPSPEIRQIKEYSVFIVTGAFSLFAYFWLVFIVQIVSPDVVEVWEALVTLLLFPVLIIISYMADIGRLPGMKGKPAEVPCPHVDSGRRLGDQDEPSCLRSGVPQLRRPHSWSGPQTVTGAACRPLAHDMVAEVRSTATTCEPIKDKMGQPIPNSVGVITFENDTLYVHGGMEEKMVRVCVMRLHGSEVSVSCKYKMEKLSAIPGYDYQDPADGEGIIEFAPGETRAEIPVIIMRKQLGEHSDQFQIILEDVEGDAIFNPNSDGGHDRCVLTVTILNESEVITQGSLLMKANRCIDRMVNYDVLRLTSSTWREEIVDSIIAVSGEDDAEASVSDWIMHIISFPWKLGFALLIPPPVLAGGWMCFTLAVGFIGFLTVVIIDFAELFGCVTGVADSITAITIVALGTSMPDLFASMTAAAQDPYADASIVNVTGSNSVNVFLGIGLPWTLASIYWAVAGATPQWKQLYGEFLPSYPNGAFVVKGGDLGFSVIVFSIAAVVCLGVLKLRRVKLGGELGGAFGPKLLSAILLLMLWVFYLVLSIWKVQAQSAGVGMQILAICIGLIVLENVMVMAGVGVWLAGGLSKMTKDLDPEAAHGDSLYPKDAGHVKVQDGRGEDTPCVHGTPLRVYPPLRSNSHQLREAGHGVGLDCSSDELDAASVATSACFEGAPLSQLSTIATVALAASKMRRQAQDHSAPALAHNGTVRGTTSPLRNLANPSAPATVVQGYAVGSLPRPEFLPRAQSFHSLPDVNSSQAPCPAASTAPPASAGADAPSSMRWVTGHVVDWLAILIAGVAATKLADRPSSAYGAGP